MSCKTNFNIFIKELKEKRKKERLANSRGQKSLGTKDELSSN